MEGLYWIHMSVWYLLSQRHFKCIVSVGGRRVSILIVFFLAEIEKKRLSRYEDYYIFHKRNQYNSDGKCYDRIKKSVSIMATESLKVSRRTTK